MSEPLTKHWVLDTCFLTTHQPDEFTRNKGLTEQVYLTADVDAERAALRQQLAEAHEAIDVLTTKLSYLEEKTWPKRKS